MNGRIQKIEDADKRKSRKFGPRLYNIVSTQRRFRSPVLSQEESLFTLNALKEYEAMGLIKESDSEFNTPLFTVPKDSNAADLAKRYRLVFDYRAANQICQTVSTDLPAIQEVLQFLASAKVGSAIDILSAFHQVRLDPTDADLLAFTHPVTKKRMTWTAWPFGFSFSPAAMERMVSPLVDGLEEHCKAYVDDISIATGKAADRTPVTLDDIDAHLKVLERFLTQCKENKVYLSKKKAQLFRHDLDVLGSKVLVGKEILIDPGRVRDLTSMPPPANLKELEKSMGSLAFIGSSIKRFAEITTPLRKIITLGRRLDKTKMRGGKRPSHILFPLDEEASRSWDLALEAVTSAEPLSPFNPTADVTLVTDASAVALAGYLLQDGKLVGLFSKALSETQARYAAFELEALALAESVKRFKPFLTRRRVRCLTDHRNLRILGKPSRLSKKVRRWLAEISDCTLSIE